MKRKTKIGVIGIGMVGIPHVRYFKNAGYPVYRYDKYKKEEGSREEVNRADIIFICVPTPFNEKRQNFDLSCILSAFRVIKGVKTIIIKSTVLPGTTEKLQKKYPRHRILFNPEFLTETTADQDMRYPDRQIVGYTTKSYSVARDVLQFLPLAPFERLMPAREAETVKYFGNTWFAVKVAFANQVYDLCEALKVNYDRIAEAAAADKRIGRSHLEVWHKGYRGYGGKCIPKDTKAFIAFADTHGVDLKLHKTAEEINNLLLKIQHIDDAEKFGVR